jgi:hypothetical protein
MQLHEENVDGELFTNRFVEKGKNFFSVVEEKITVIKSVIIGESCFQGSFIVPKLQIGIGN